MRHVLIGDLARALHGRVKEVKPMALVSAYFDESGTDGLRGVTILAGYIGTDSRWEAVEKEWLHILEVYEIPVGRFGIPVMHLVDALVGRGDFSHLGSKRHDMIIRLSKILGEGGIIPLFSGVLDDDWNEVACQDADFIARFPKPLDLCYEDIIMQMRLVAAQNPHHERPALIFSHQPEYYERMQEIARVYAQSPSHNESIGSIAFSTPDELAPLQCADFFAHEMRHEIEHINYGELTLANMGGRVILNNAAPKGRPGHYFDKSGLLLTIDRFKRTGKIS